MARRDPTKTDRVGLAIALLTITSAVIGQIGGLIMIRDGRESLRWPAVEGTIERSWIKKHTSKSNSGSRTTRYHVYVSYRYSVGGKSYRRRQHSVDRQRWRSCSTREKAKRWAAQHAPVGRRITVYYAPRDPGRTVIERGTSPGMYFLLFFSLIFLGVGWIFLQHARPEQRRQRTRAMHITAALIGGVTLALDVIALALL